MYESEKQEKRDALQRALAALAHGSEIEGDAGLVATLLVEYLDAQERRIGLLEDEVLLLKRFE